jgi:hypothetical protein
MTIINAENLDIRPILYWRQLIDGVDHVQNNGDSIFIVLSNKAYICVCTECLDSSKSFMGNFAILKIW